MTLPRCLIAAVLTISSTVSALAQVTPGEILLGEMNCVACHEAEPAVRARLAPRQAPRLGTDGARIRPQHLRAFLQDPTAAKPGTLMPDLLHGVLAVDREVAADALTHYLLSLQAGEQAATDPAGGRGLLRGVLEAEVRKRGELLYHGVGCVQCHAPKILPKNVSDPATANVELEHLQKTSVPLGPVPEKYTTAALAAFLLDPVKVRPSGRMPSMKLNAEEAFAIAAYLAPVGGAADAEEAFAVDPQKAARGKELYARLNCASCHGPEAPTQRAKPLVQLVSRQPAGCLSANPAPHAPKFALTDRQRIVILAALQNQALLSVPFEAREQARRTMTALNCFACHQRDRRGGASGLRRAYFTGAGREEFGDSARIPPHLNDAGAKLQPSWLEAVLERGASVRPYLSARMPQFGSANVHGLPDMLQKADAPVTPTPPIPEEKPEIEAGRILVGSEGLNCVSCHRLEADPERPPSPALDLATAPARLDRAWFRSYLLDPPAFHPGSRKPLFWPSGKATNHEILGGDTERQIAAVWAYLSQLAATNPPKPAPIGN